MLITRKKTIPTHWIFYAQIPFVMAIAANMITGAPFIYSMKKFIDNPAAITFLLSIDVFVTVLLGPFISWLSDRVWTKYGRRKPFLIIADVGKFLIFPLIPLAPNIYWLIGLKWAYGILHDIGSPKTALTMEIVPAKQRGRGSGFFNLQLQIVNLVFWGIVIGRFDDIYFTGPLAYVAGLSGEAMLYFAGALMFLFVLGFNCLGIKEIKPPDGRRIRDEKTEGRSLFTLFFIAFFKEVLAKSLLPLYLLLVVGTLTSVGLGSLSPLLYTEQWGYSLQQMGTNIAIGALLSIVIALGAGYAADASSKLKVYTWALIGGLVAKIVWTAYVYYKPGMRPELWEIVAFGQLNHTFGLIAATVSFPLILEYVTRNQLGTANAGIQLFEGLIRNWFSMFIGFYVLWWSLFFLPQAGDRVEVVLDNAVNSAFVVQALEAAGLDTQPLDIRPLHRPGTGGPLSAHWEIRRGREDASALHRERKDLTNAVGKYNTRLQSPFIKEDRAAALLELRRTAQERLTAIDTSLADSAAEFRAQLLQALEPHLFTDGQQLIYAGFDDRKLTIRVQVVEPVDLRATEQLEIFFDAADLALNLDDQIDDFVADLHILPLENPFNGLEVRLRRDHRFEAIEHALLAAGLSRGSSFNAASELISILRGMLGQAPGAFELTAVSATAQPASLNFALTIPGQSVLTGEMLADALQSARSIAEADVNRRDSVFSTQVRFTDSIQNHRSPNREVVIEERLQSLLPEADDYQIATAYNIYQRLIPVAASAPVFLTIARPLVQAGPADRRYDYFFSVQFFMIITDVLGLFVIALIVYLDRKGTIQRVGATEDDNR
ncbi:MAG: MFS transporter [Verrucomicrobia bacterium]|nr:MFS transporter [Verrucomicrobiota bacterium]